MRFISFVYGTLHKNGKGQKGGAAQKIRENEIKKGGGIIVDNIRGPDM
jgi:hypothetical protein